MNTGTNIEDVQEMNRSLVVNILRSKLHCSRIDIAMESELKRATITNLTADMINWGLIRETGLLQGRQGRRAIGIELAAEKYIVLAIRLARKFFSISKIDLYNRISGSHEEDILPGSPPRETFAKIMEAVKSELDNQDGYRIIGIGMSTPGPILYHKGKMLQVSDFLGWDAISIAEEMEKAFSVPFFFEHDANTGAFSEWVYGQYANSKTVLAYVAVGQGIGAGIVADGKIMRGSMGFFGEIGHTSIDYNGKVCECGNRGCLTQYASTLQLVRLAKENLPMYHDSILHQASKINADTVLAGVRSRDELCVTVFTEIARFLAIGVINVIHSYNPDVIIIGDELIRGGELLLDIVKDTVRRNTSPIVSQNTIVKLSSQQEDPTVLGTGAMVIDELCKTPTKVFGDISPEAETGGN